MNRRHMSFSPAASTTKEQAGTASTCSTHTCLRHLKHRRPRNNISLWLDLTIARDITGLMRLGFPRRLRLLLVPSLAVLLFVMIGCGNSSIVGKWRMSGTENQTVWEFSSNGAVLVGEVRGRYKFGDQDRLKIETPFATTVYLATLSNDQLVLQDLGGSKLEFTRVR